MGVLVNGSKSYGQVPGLKLHFDGRYLKNTIQFGGVPITKTWNSLTGDYTASLGINNTQVEQDSANFLHVAATGSINKGYSLNVQDRSVFNFLHSNNFGIFGIQNYNFISGSGTCPILDTGGGTNTTIGVQLRIGSNNRLRFLMSDGVNAFPSPSIEPVATFTPGQTFSYGLVRRGIATTDNLNWYLDNVNHQNNSITKVITGEYTKLSFNILSVFSTWVGDLYYGKLLIYDWSGFSEAQIDAFSLSVRTLLEAEKPLFTI